MRVKDFIKIYREDPIIQTIAERTKPNEGSHIQLRGLIGSLDAVIAAAIYQENKQTCLFVMHDKEEAAYFHNDLQNLIGDKEVLLFPTSYKRPYQFDEIENANILMRAEILNRINNKASTGELIVTYPEALTEKVINKKSLTTNTFTTKVGEEIDVQFLSELLMTYDFEKTDFVYEAGQFSVRGGIVDVYSYAHDLPYRLELFGKEVESIRTFDPVSQLSEESVKQINIIPNIQTRLLQEGRQSFLDFIPNNTKLWFKDYHQTLDIIDKYFEKASNSFDEVLSVTDAQIVLSPDQLFETKKSFQKGIVNFVKIEFGNRFGRKVDFEYRFEGEPQQSFNKNFDLIVENLAQWQMQSTTLLVSAESLNQINRLETIFTELNPLTQVQPLNIGLRQGFIDKTLKILCYTDHQLFDRFHKYKLKNKHSKSKALTLKELRSLQAGDYVTHIDHGVGRFAGMEKIEVNGNAQES
ncbi:MAG: transcription-repair coupling factor (superfamily II helicase), partial [Candidatus Endobugula sp.]